MTTISARGDLHELFSGVLHKVGGKIKTWNKRYFILKSDYCLYYYKDTSKGALGVISLRDPKFKVRQGEASDISWPRTANLQCTMAIITTHRTYYVYCDYSHEIEEWIRMLTKAREKMITTNLGKRGENKLLSGGRSSSSSAVETAHENNNSQHNDKPRPVSSFEQTNYEPVYATPTEGETELEVTATTTTSSSNGGQGVGEGIYDLAKPEVDIYEDVDQVKSPSTTSQAGNHHTPYEVLYEDIPSKTPQPLYDSIALNDKTSQRRDTGSSSDGEVFPLSLPSRGDDLPPLPARNNVPPTLDENPPLPARNSIPPLPPKEDALANVPPLPSKDDNLPPLPSKDDPPIDVPPLPSKDDPHYDVPPSPSKDDSPIDVPPLPNKDENIPLKEDSPVMHHQSPQLTPPPHRHIPPTTPPSYPHNDHPPSPKPRSRSNGDTPPTPHKTPPTPHKTTPRSSLGSSDGSESRPSPVPRRKSPAQQQQTADQQDQQPHQKQDLEDRPAAHQQQDRPAAQSHQQQDRPPQQQQDRPVAKPRARYSKCIIILTDHII